MGRIQPIVKIRSNASLVTDHGVLSGLTPDDDHSQYALLAGRSGGQILIGGTGSGDDLTLETTSHASKGSYILSDLTTDGVVLVNSGVLSSIAELSVADGGTALSTVAAGSILAANSLDTLTAITSTSGLKVLKNNAGTVSWNSVTGTGDSVMATSPTLVTPALGVATATSINALTLTAAEVGFTIAGGTTSKTLTVDETKSLSHYVLADGTRNITGDLTIEGGDLTLGDADSAGTIVFNSGAGATDTLTYAEVVDLTDAGATTLHKHDHGGQDGLGDDDHTQYVLLAGRAGGQTLNGGTATGNDLTIRGTSHGDNNGDILLNDLGGNVGIGIAATARLALPAGTATASTAPLKLTSGISLTAPEAGAFEFTTDTLSFTITTGPTRKTIAFLESPSFTTPSLGVATAISINKVAITAPAASATLTIADGKTLTVSNTLTFSGNDSASLAIGAGGTLGTAAYTAAADYAVAAKGVTGGDSHDHNGGDGATIPILGGGTGQTTATAAFDALAPTTTAGDLIIKSTNNARLAGNATATPMYLRQLGNGAAVTTTGWIELDISHDTSPTLGGSLTVGENGIILDPALSADGTYSGIVEAGIAGAALAFGDSVYFAVADSRWELADADAEATAGPVKLGICVLAAAGDGSATTVLLWGKVRADTAFPALTVGAPAYVSTTAGDIQTAQPSGTDDVIRICGYGNTADELFFCPENSYVTHV